MSRTSVILLASFLGLTVGSYEAPGPLRPHSEACLCCVELFHMAWKGRGRRMMSRWLKPHEQSDSDASTSEASEVESQSATRARL